METGRTGAFKTSDDEPSTSGSGPLCYGFYIIHPFNCFDSVLLVLPTLAQANNLQRAGITVDHHLESLLFLIPSNCRAYKKHLKEILDGRALLKHSPVKVGSQPCFLFLPLGWKTALTCMLYAYSFLIKGNDRWLVTSREHGNAFPRT